MMISQRMNAFSHKCFCVLLAWACSLAISSCESLSQTEEQQRFGNYLHVTYAYNPLDEKALTELGATLQEFVGQYGFEVHVYLRPVASIEERLVALEQLHRKHIAEQDGLLLYFEPDRDLALFKASTFVDAKRGEFARLIGMGGVNLSAKSSRLLEEAGADKGMHGVAFVSFFTLGMLDQLQEEFSNNVAPARSTFWVKVLIFIISASAFCLLFHFQKKRKRHEEVSSMRYRFPAFKVATRLGGRRGGLLSSRGFSQDTFGVAPTLQCAEEFLLPESDHYGHDEEFHDPTHGVAHR